MSEPVNTFQEINKFVDLMATVQRGDEFYAPRDDAHSFMIGLTHIMTCRADLQRSASHHLGVGEAYEDVHMKQMLDMMQVSIDTGNQIIEKSNNLLEHTNKMFKQVQDQIDTLAAKEKEVIRVVEEQHTKRKWTIKEKGGLIGSIVAALVAGLGIGAI
ncbi:hypothetical protein KAR91_77490 [Candidatus Pacearchaeota archaeon]|nr:hypothetical protein [Candidatus Pacearchaeota archaeon]